PSLYQQSSFWTSSPTDFPIRVGILMVALAVMFAIDRISRLLPVFVFSWQRPLETLGRSSLFVYWIHVELVYGYASWIWKGRLPLWASLAGCALFSLLMYRAVLLRDRVLQIWRSRRTPSPRPTSAPA